MNRLASNGRTSPWRWATMATALAVVAIGAFVSSAAEAQRNQTYGRSNRPPRSAEPGKFDYYVMSLSWSPSYCAGATRGGYEPQCNGPRRFSFVLHGVWPQFEKGWPENCQTPGDSGYVPRPVAQRMADIMPSDKLVFHEYRAHGTCSGLGVDGYFEMARSLYNKVKIPPRFAAITDPRMFIAPSEIMADFLAANPTMSADGIAVDCGGPGPRLKEVRICFDKGGSFRACGRNENQSRMCNAPRVYLPPVRGGRVPATPAVGQRI